MKNRIERTRDFLNKAAGVCFKAFFFLTVMYFLGMCFFAII